MENVKLLNIGERIKSVCPDALCFEDSFFLFTIRHFPVSDRPFKMNTYGFCLCLEGTAQVSIDLMPYELRAGMMAVNVPGQLITRTCVSEDFRGISQVMKQRFIDSLGLPYNFGLIIGIREHPVLALKPGELDAIRNYYDMVRNLLEKKRPYQAATLRHLTCAYAYGLGSYLYHIAESRHLSNDEMLMQRFLAELRTHYKQERRVSYYAERLHITTGYLSTLVHRVSGKSPSDWINDFVVMEAKVLLKSSALTVQQIAHELNFPSQSFFGKYFKRLVGIPPKDYRERQNG